VATRKDFDPTHYSDEELDRIKLEDGIRIHEDTKVALDIYARAKRHSRSNHLCSSLQKTPAMQAS